VSRALANGPLLIVVVLILGTTLACSGLPISAEPTPDTQATVDAAVAATKAAEVNMQATVDAAIQATQQAAADTLATEEAAAAPTAEPPPPVEPAATPAPVEEYVTLSEEELAMVIDQAVNEAIAANEAYSQAANSSSSDYYLTAEEIQELEELIYLAETAITYADDLIYLYYGLYGDLAYETLYLLQDVEDDLDEMLAYAEQLIIILDENSETIEQGLELATETITQIQETAQAAMNVAAETRPQTQEWMQQLDTLRDTRIEDALTIPPNSIPEDRLGAVVSGFQFSDAVLGSFQDGAISPEELTNIAQLGANAHAGLEAHGGPGLEQLGGSITSITEGVAGGEWTRARGEVKDFEVGLGERPSELPDRPQIDKPDLEMPDKPEFEKPDRPEFEKPELPKPRK
jgi:hypothetical protein